MKLAAENGHLFYKLYPALMCYTNQRLKVVEKLASAFEKYMAVPEELRLMVRDTLFSHRELIDEFVRKNPSGLTLTELSIVSSWKKAVVGTFYIVRYLKDYTVFLDDRKPPKAYGVVAVVDPLEELLGPTIPVLTPAVLLPFQGTIICDGLLSPFRSALGPIVRQRINEAYREAKDNYGIIRSLPFQE
jgi:hypothetical protein